MRLSLRASYAAALAALVAACGQQPAALPAPAFAPAAANVAPPKCKGQQDNKKRASLKVTLSTKGGSLCVPAFGGFGGSIEYPKVERSVVLTIRTSTSNIYDEPLLGTGTPILYLNLHFRAGTHFEGSVKSEGGVQSAQIEPGQPYTSYGEVTVGHLALMFPPCYSNAMSGPYGGLIPNIGSMLRNTTITGAGYGVLEIYSGAQVSQEC
ncbi:MAG TPA: hypothetical protein VFF63_07075 [Candidatus Babeliales bacterium]|nr:hypothetical protein [Candidatus Babeliales bacterium]